MKVVTIPLATTLMLGWTPVVAAEVSGLVDSERPPETQRTEVGISLLGAFGAGGRFEDNAINRYGLGVGARAGATLKAPSLFLGVSFVRFFGGKDQSGRFYTSTLDAEVGYDLRLLHKLLVVRPEVALGIAQAVTIQSDNAGYPLGVHWAPGLLVGIRLPSLLVSTEVRRDMVPDQWSNAVTFMLGCGVVF
jgi:hypothetical protein